MPDIDPQMLAQVMQQRQARGQMMQQLMQGSNPQAAAAQQQALEARRQQMMAQAQAQQQQYMQNRQGPPTQAQPQTGKGQLFGGRLGPMYQMGSPEAAAAQQAAIQQSIANGSQRTGQMMSGKGSPR